MTHHPGIEDGRVVAAIREQETEQRDFTPGNEPTQGGTEHAKEVATLAAHLALAGGYELHELRSGGFLIVRSGLVRHVTALEGVAGFLREVQP